ncbi:MAG: hypothetical protein ABIV28_00450 [Longimicrobiales bacterium]
MPSDERFIRNARLIGIAIGALFVSRYLTTWAVADTWTILDNIDLAIHEAGHMVFMPFGEFMMVLGGSLFQILVPAIFVAYFAKQKQWYSALFLLLWLGQSCFNLSYYIADARARVLPLLSDDPTSHDWTWLLLQMGLLNQDRAIGNGVRIIGLMMFVTGVVGCVRVAIYRPPAPSRSVAHATPLVTRTGGAAE